MIKTKDISKGLKAFNSLFNDLIYRHDASRVFSDFLTIVICCFAFGTQEPLYFETIKGYSKKELEQFAKLMGELLLIYDTAVKDEIWTDPLGEYYEILAGRFKKSGLGQFFTPVSLCDLMAQITLLGSDWDTTISDPCSGSGRLILASNQITKDMTYTAQDIDPICCKMTAINLAMHQIKGTVLLGNTLSGEKPRKVYYINPQWAKLKHPHILIQ